MLVFGNDKGNLAGFWGGTSSGKKRAGHLVIYHFAALAGWY